MAQINPIYFSRTNLDQNLILKDKIVKKHIRQKYIWLDHLIIVFKDETPEDIVSYIMLKYGDDVVDPSYIIKDRTPIAGIDYTIQRK